MWNHIRGPPYAGQKDGKPEIFAPGFSSQYVGETQAVGMLCKKRIWRHVCLNSLNPLISINPHSNLFQSININNLNLFYKDALIAVTFVALITKPTTLKSDSLQRIVAYIFLGAFVFLYSLLLDIFKIKNGGYPFKMVSGWVERERDSELCVCMNRGRGRV